MNLPVLWVDNDTSLNFALKLLSDATRVSVDLEADAMHHYPEKICLLQLATDKNAILIDPLAIKDLECLSPLFENDNVLKIFHGGDFDVRSLYRDFGITVKNLFDTQIACRFLGETETSLEALIRMHFGIQIDKKYQKSDWSQRLLPEDMKAYALADVIYLGRLQEVLQKKLEEKDRLFWVKEEFEHLCSVRPQSEEGFLFLRFKGAGLLKPRELAVLEKLLCWRQETALRMDLPPYKILGSETILKLISHLPLNMMSLEQTDFLSKRQQERWGKQIVATILEARELPSKNWPKYPKHPRKVMSGRVKERTKRLKEWRDITAANLEIADVSVIASKAMLVNVAELENATIEDLYTVAGIRNWQITVFGEELLRVIMEKEGNYSSTVKTV